MSNSGKIAGKPGQHQRTGKPSVDELYRLHDAWLRTFVSSRLRLQPADVDDIIQDTYLRAARQAPAVITRPKAYLFRIALNLFRDRQRRTALRSDHVQAVSECASAIGTMEMTEQEGTVQIERLVLGMPERYRDVFVLSRFRHMSNKEIASHLGISIKTVEWRMSKALEFCVRWLRD